MSSKTINKESVFKDDSQAGQTVFQKHKIRLARQLFEKYNETVFESRLPRNLTIVWSSRLRTTSGNTRCKEKKGKKVASIVLGTRVVNDPKKLRRTLSHEMCHVSEWLLDGKKLKHGARFRFWARRVTKSHPSLAISTHHDYIPYEHRWHCTNPSCRQIIQRRTKFETDEMVCGLCRSKLLYVY